MRAERRARSARSHALVAPLGDVRIGEQRRHCATVRTSVEQRSGRPSSTAVPPICERCVEHDHVEVDRDRDGAADPGARAERDVHRAEDLLVLEHVAGQRRAVVGSDPELGEVASRARRGRAGSSRYSGPRPDSAATIRPFSTVSRAGSSLRPSGARLEATIVPSPLSGAMKPSPAGRLPNAPGAVRSPSSATPARPVRVECEVRCRAGRSRGPRRPSASSSATARDAPRHQRRSRPPSRVRACPR